jgi:hypothetical protein
MLLRPRGAGLDIALLLSFLSFLWVTVLLIIRIRWFVYV